MGELLVDGGFTSPQELEAALTEQSRTHRPLGDILRSQGVLGDEETDAILRLQQRLRCIPDGIVRMFRRIGGMEQARAATGVRLGDLLVQRGDITVAELHAALREQRETGRKLGEILVETGKVSRKDVKRRLRLQKNLLSAAFGAAMALGSVPAFAGGATQTGSFKAADLNPAQTLVSIDQDGGDPDAPASFPELRDAVDADLEEALQQTLRDMGLAGAAQNKQLAVALVDVTDEQNPRMAAINGDHMMYAASLPKIGIMLGAMQSVSDGALALDDGTRDQLTRMIRSSSNSAATAMYNAVGPENLARTLEAYGLYDTSHNGGLWVGKPYAKGAAWKRDPLHGVSHGATPIQVARFLYMMETGQLASPELSAEMKQMMSDPAINHKFVKGLGEARPGSKIYRKSGTWRTYHSDCAVVERDGRKYIAVALSNSSQGSSWLSRLIVELDDIVFDQQDSSVQVASAR